MLPLLLLTLIWGCKTTHEENLPQVFSDVSYTGYDRGGQENTCVKDTSDRFCATQPGQMAEFLEECLRRGHKVYICSCDATKDLCSFNIIKHPEPFVGFDRNGRAASCIPLGSFPPNAKPQCLYEGGLLEKNYAFACRNAGYTVMECACQRYLCQEKL